MLTSQTHHQLHRQSRNNHIIMKSLLPVLVSVFLSGCASYSDTRQIGNATEFIINADYKTAYRIIDQKFKDCQGIDGVSSTIYPDLNKATIAFGMNQVVAFSADLEAAENGSTNGTFYTTYNAQKEYIQLFKAWVDEGKSGCSMSKLK